LQQDVAHDQPLGLLVTQPQKGPVEPKLSS
jgi:hypothetical protein